MSHDRTYCVTSADGLLPFSVWRTKDDLILCFQGFEWRTHGDVLAELSGKDVETAVPQYVEALLHNQSLIAVERDGGTLCRSDDSG